MTYDFKLSLPARHSQVKSKYNYTDSVRVDFPAQADSKSQSLGICTPDREQSIIGPLPIVWADPRQTNNNRGVGGEDRTAPQMWSSCRKGDAYLCRGIPFSAELSFVALISIQSHYALYSVRLLFQQHPLFTSGLVHLSRSNPNPFSRLCLDDFLNKKAPRPTASQVHR